MVGARSVYGLIPGLMTVFNWPLGLCRNDKEPADCRSRRKFSAGRRAGQSARRRVDLAGCTLIWAAGALGPDSRAAGTALAAGCRTGLAGRRHGPRGRLSARRCRRCTYLRSSVCAAVAVITTLTETAPSGWSRTRAVGAPNMRCQRCQCSEDNLGSRQSALATRLHVREAVRRSIRSGVD